MNTCKATNRLPLATRWENLPDPRVATEDSKSTSLALQCSSWQHVVEKHLCSANEPWQDALAPDRLRQLQQTVAEGGSPTKVDASVIFEQLGTNIRQALQLPLVILYEARLKTSSATRPWKNWLLVLPCGAKAFVHERSSDNFLVTCFLPRAAVQESRPARRWIAVARKLVVLYGTLDAEKNCLSPPLEEKVVCVPREDSKFELRSAIRFVQLENWGFRPELNGCPWHGRFPAWEAADKAKTAPSRTTPRRQLRRRKTQDCEYDEL